MEFETPKQLEAVFRDMQPCFEGKETEQNWQQREKNVAKLKRITASQAPQELTAVYLAGVRSLLDGILKTVNSLRTTLSSAGCSLVQDVANASGPGIDGMVEILLQNLIKLCASTKPISRTNGNDAVLAILSNASYHLRLMNHVHIASQDKNILPRRFACGWLKKIIKKHPRNVIEHGGGLDLIEKSLRIGLEDRDKDVREAMRPTFWAFARRWPERSDAILSSLDKIKQDQLLADESNPNRHLVEPSTLVATDEKSKFSKSTSSIPSGKPSLKEVKAKLAAEKKSEPTPENSNVGTAHRSHGAEDDIMGRRTASAIVGDHRPAFSRSTNLAAKAKPSLKDIKARMAAQKKTQAAFEADNRIDFSSATNANLSEPSSSIPNEMRIGTKHEGHPTPLPDRSSRPSSRDMKTMATAPKRAQEDSQATLVDSQSAISSTYFSPERGNSLDVKKSRARHDPVSTAPSPAPRSVRDEDIITVPVVSKSHTQQKKPASLAERPSSADGPARSAVHHQSGAAARSGNLTSAPMRPRRKPIGKKPETEPTDSAALEHGDTREQETIPGLKLRSEPLQEDEIPEGTMLAEKAAIEPEVPSKQELFKVHEAFENVRLNKQGVKSESPLHCLKLLESAQVRIQARSLDLHGFRKLQNLIRDQSSNASIWQEGYKIEELLLPLLEWLEQPLAPSNDLDIRDAVDLKTQILFTVRAILTNHKNYAKPFFAHTLSTILVAREQFTGKEHIVSGLEDTLAYIVANCQPKECMNTICDMIEHDLGNRAYELALHTLSSLLHRLHQAPTEGGLGQMFKPSDETLFRRLGRITTALLEDKELVTRRAAIEVALEFYYCVPEEDFFKLITRKNENHRNVLLYYLSRHKKVHDATPE